MRNLLALRKSQIELADRTRWLVREVENATRHLVEREEEVIWRLARAIEYRDGDTGEHVSRVALICRLVAGAMGLSAERCRIIYLRRRCTISARSPSPTPFWASPAG